MILDFNIHNWVDILTVLVLFILSVIPFIPATFAGFNKTFYDTYRKKWVKQKKLNFFELIIHLISHTILTGPALSMGLRGTVTLILFIVLGADLYFNRKITNNAVTLSIVGIIALYLEKFLDTAEEISIWKIFTWKAKNQTSPNLPIAESEESEDKGSKY